MNLLYVHFWIYESVTSCDFFYFYEFAMMCIFGFLLLSKSRL